MKTIHKGTQRHTKDEKSTSPQRRKGRKGRAAQKAAPSMFGAPEKQSPFIGAAGAAMRGVSGVHGDLPAIGAQDMGASERAPVTPEEKAVAEYETAQANRAAAEQARIARFTTESAEEKEARIAGSFCCQSLTEIDEAVADAQWSATPCDCPGHTNGTCQFPDCLLIKEGGAA